ncbi:MAG: hypothetical protein MJZ76_06220 [Bacteroidales bacterium]|nr:hypothetical protein [Bacteroidales bacterium]
MKKACLIFQILFFLPILQAQELPISIDLKEQLSFIAHDTLPVKTERLSKEINTSYSEYNGTMLADSTFFFTSLRPETSGDYENLFEEYWSTKIYCSHLTISGFSTPKAMSISINSPSYFNCNFTFNEAKNKVYFSRCLREASETGLQCEIWESDYSHGKWEKAKRITRKINLPGTTTTQPHLVEYDDCDILYFVSDRPGGYGGLDIWYSVNKGNKFGDPINLGSIINGPNDEVTPYYDLKHNTLYFSSNREFSIGGFDIFSSEGAFGIWQNPQNIGVPFNSPENDFYFSLNAAEEGKGFFSSNRPSNNDTSTCCHDIYSFYWIKQNPDTTIKDSIPQQDTISIEQKIQNILPLTLYFHNDEPNPKSWDTTTSINYKATLANYIQLKETYKNEYSKGLRGNEKQKAEETIEHFFTDSLEQGFRKLELFTSLLIQELAANKKIEITISGFASPLHKADYNLHLSSRRIVSLKNYLKEYDNGYFIPYIKKEQLIIHEQPKGQSQANKFVSDNINDQRNSVYSIAASLERRIQISEYKSFK